MKPRVACAAPDDDSGAHHLAPIESNVFVKLHAIVAHCSVTRYEGGTARKPGWITIKTMGASWVVQMKDPDTCQSCQAIGATLDDALALADLILSSPTGPWEPDPFLKQQAAKVGKK